MVENKQLWDNVLGSIEINVSKANFSTWFKNTHIIERNEGVVFLAVPNEFVKDWLFNKYHKIILKYLRELSSGVRGLEYTVLKEVKEESINIFNTQQKTNSELPLSDLYIDKKNNLNPRYTFNSFVIGSFNDLAHAAALAVTKNPGVLYNPFFIHGGTGLGKTHLIQSIGNNIKENSDKKVYYITSEKFAVDFISSLQNGKINDFKNKYRKYDVFIMDDVQFIAGKEKTQDELFHVFDSLYSDGKQIIFSSDKHPNFIPGLEERLKSRFSAGMIVPVSLPEYEARLAILKEKAASRSFFPAKGILEYIASSIDGNIRELEGILNSLILQSQIKNKDLKIDEIKVLLKDSAKPKKTMSVKEIIKIVSGFYKIKESDIYEKTRKKEIVKPRQIIMFLLREDFNISFPTIGQKLGGRDHTTAIHSCDKIKKDLKNDNILLQEIEQIRSMF